MIKKLLKYFSLAAVVAASTLGVTSPAMASPIASTTEAASVCSTLPGGTASVSRGYCAFNDPNESVACVVSSVGSAPNFGNGCRTFSLSEMVGQEPSQIQQSAASGGGVAINPTTVNTGGDLDEENPIIKKVLKPLIRTLSAAVGLVVIISLIVSGIQYSAARDNSQMVAAAKNRILMSLLALVIFIFGFAVLQWLVPSGIL